MIENLNNLDTRLFLWINGHHNTVADWTFWTLSQHWCWAVVLLLFFAVVTLRHERRRWWLVLAAVVLCFLMADQASVHLIKDTVCRLRPCHVLDGVHMFRTRCGGQYGFVSSHAANAFAILTFLLLRYQKRPWACLLMSLWALLTCYSRIYLGKHYPGDVIGGALLGAVVGLVVWLVASAVEKKLHPNETK